MDPFIEEEIMRNHNQADSFIALFFAGLDVACYIIILFLFGFKFGSCNSPKQKLFLLLVLDAIVRIIDMYTNEFSKYFIKELFFTLVSTIQFIIIISSLNQMFREGNTEGAEESDSEIRNKYPLSFIFFALTFSFKGIINSYKFISCLQYISSIICVFILSKYVSRKIEAFMSDAEKKGSSLVKENFVNNVPFFISVYWIIRYLFELFSLFIENKLYISYNIMVCKVFKEVGKYLVILLLTIIYHSYYNIVGEGDYEYSQEKNKVDIYKDEEELN